MLNDSLPSFFRMSKLMPRWTIRKLIRNKPASAIITFLVMDEYFNAIGFYGLLLTEN
jgi:hypothetical protein